MARPDWSRKTCIGVGGRSLKDKVGDGQGRRGRGSLSTMLQVCHLEKGRGKGRRIWVGKSLHLQLSSKKGLARLLGNRQVNAAQCRSSRPLLLQREVSVAPCHGCRCSGDHSTSHLTDGGALSDRPARFFCLAGCTAWLEPLVPMVSVARSRLQSSMHIVDCNKANDIVFCVTHLSLRITRVKVLLR